MVLSKFWEFAATLRVLASSRLRVFFIGHCGSWVYFNLKNHVLRAGSELNGFASCTFDQRGSQVAHGVMGSAIFEPRKREEREAGEPLCVCSSRAWRLGGSESGLGCHAPGLGLVSFQG